MCLSTVDKVTQTGTGEGYKVFDYDESYHLKPQCQEGGRYKYETWYENNYTKRIRAINKKHYKSGYHIFCSLEDAKHWNSVLPIRKVKYENVTSSGTQNGLNVIVAQRMYICKCIY